MNIKNLIIRKSHIEDIPLIQYLIKGLASYEKRPQDMTGTKEQLSYWLFERKVEIGRASCRERVYTPV